DRPPPRRLRRTRPLRASRSRRRLSPGAPLRPPRALWKDRDASGALPSHTCAHFLVTLAVGRRLVASGPARLRLNRWNQAVPRTVATLPRDRSLGRSRVLPHGGLGLRSHG